jgi:hypothetical protein
MTTAEVPKPSDIESEVLHFIDARQKLQAAIDAQELKRKEAELDLAKSIEKDARAKSIDVEAAFQKNEVWRTTDAQYKQRIEALGSILEKVNKHIAKLKAQSRQAVKSALTRKIETLEKTLNEKEGAERDLIKKLQAEMDMLTEAAAAKAS